MKKGMWVILILLAAAVVRFTFNLQISGEQFNDAYYMGLYAEDIANTGHYPLDHGIYWSPGYLYGMAGVIALVGIDHHYLIFRLIQSLLSVMGLYGFYLLSLRVFNRPTALLTLILLAIYPPLIQLSGMVFSENLFFILAPWLFLLLMKWHEKGGYVYPIGAGIMFGILHLTRPVILPLLVIFIGFSLFLRKREKYTAFARELGICLLLFGLALTPWVVHNYGVYGKIVTSNAVGGLNFYIAHNPAADGHWVQIDTNSEVLRLAGTPQGNDLGYQEGIRFLLGNPDQEVRNTLKKVYLFWLKSEPFWSPEADGLWAARYRIPILPIGLLSMSFFFGLWLLPKQGPTVWLLAGYILIYFAMLITLYHAPRYRLIVEPFLLIYFSGVLVHLYQRIFQSKGLLASLKLRAKGA